MSPSVQLKKIFSLVSMVMYKVSGMNCKVRLLTDNIPGTGAYFLTFYSSDLNFSVFIDTNCMWQKIF